MKFRFKVLNEEFENTDQKTKLEESSNKLETILGSLTPAQLEYIEKYWNAFYNEPEKYSIYADMIKETMAEKGIE